VWWLGQATELSPRAKRALAAGAEPGRVVASAISIFEIATLVRRGRLQLGVALDQWLNAMRSLPELRIEPVSDEIAQLAGGLDAPMHGDPADRLIAATAISLDARLVTADERLRAFPGVVTVW
jgi:PIN domain nuclease of toxin-antitoxin system